MSKSNRRNYRNKADSDEESSATRLSTPTNSKIETENRLTLSFVDEFNDIESFKEKKIIHSKKTIIKSKEIKKKVVKPIVTPKIDDLDICIQNNVTINVKSLNPRPVEIRDDYYDYNDDDIISPIIQKGDIPDSMSIDRVKKQRELAKKRLETERSSSEDESKPFKSNRFTSYITQQDINTDETKRISMHFDVNASEKERQLIRDQFLSVEQGSDKDSDQENEWEARQLQSAMNIVINTTKDAKKVDWKQHAKDNEDVEIRSETLDVLHSISLEDISVITISDLLKQRKAEIIMSRDANESDIYNKEKNLINNDEKANVAIREIPFLEAKFNCFNNFKRFLNILVQCFDEKMEKIVYLEKKYLKIHKERSDKLIKRSRQDVQDQFDEIILKIKTSAIQSTFEMTNRSTRICEKESRRLRRIRARETANIVNHYDGLSSDEDEPKSSLTGRQNEIDQIKTDAAQMFDDSDPEYCSIESIIKKFVDVKSQFDTDYHDTYINGFLPHVLNPVIRIELISWNPLMVPHFHKWNWFKALIQFTKDSVGTTPIDETSFEFGDLKIIPTIIDKVVVPKLAEWASIWNPMSKTETQNLVKIINKLISQVPAFNSTSVHVRNLMRSISCRVYECVSEDISIPLYIDQYKENPNGTAFLFFQRQMWTIIKSFTNIMMLHDIIDNGLLCKLALEGILNNYIVTGLMILSEMGQVNDIITKVNMIKHSFPEHWFVKSSDGETCVDIVEELSSLITFINTFGFTHRKDKFALTFAFSTLDYFNVGRGELLGMMKE